MSFDDTHLNEAHYGNACPVGKVQLETVSAGSQRTNFGSGFMPTDHITLDLYIDGHRFYITAGKTSAGTRGLRIVTSRELVTMDKGVNFLQVGVKP